MTHTPLQFDYDEKLLAEFLNYSIPVIIATPMLQPVGAELLRGPDHQESAPDDDMKVRQ